MNSKRKVYNIIIKELEDIIVKFGNPRKTKIITDTIVDDNIDMQEVADYPVNLFFTREGYFKKITPQSLRMSGEQKLKDGDEIVQTFESNNVKELLFFTDKCQVYKAKVSDFDDTKASVLGDYIPAKLCMDEGENAIYMVVTDDYSGFMLFFFLNGRISKVSLSAYITKTNRHKLVGAYSDKFDLCKIIFIQEDCEVLLKSSGGRMLLVHTGILQSKATKSNGGVAVMTQKKGQRLFDAVVYSEDMLKKPHRYRTRNLPAAGSMPSPDESAEQLTL